MQPNIHDEVANNAVLDYMELHQHLSEKVEAEAKIDFITFVRQMAPSIVSDFKMGRHIEVISEKLQQVRKGEIKRLMVFFHHVLQVM